MCDIGSVTSQGASRNVVVVLFVLFGSIIVVFFFSLSLFYPFFFARLRECGGGGGEVEGGHGQQEGWKEGLTDPILPAYGSSRRTSSWMGRGLKRRPVLCNSGA